MTEAELIQQITREVLKQLRQGAGQGPSAPAPAGPKVLLLYTGGDQCLDEAVAVAGDLAAAGAQVRILCTPSARALLGSTRLERLASAGELMDEPTEAEIYGAVHWADVVAVPVLTQNTAAKCALGIRDTPATNLLAAALMMNRRVVVCPDSAVPSTANAPYRAMLEAHIDKLRTFGVETLPAAAIAQACLGQAKPAVREQPPVQAQAPAPAQASVQAAAPAPATPATSCTWPADTADAPLKLVTAGDVEKAVQNGVRQVVIARGAIVTPLARDLCRNHGVALVGPDGGETHAAG